MVHGKWIVGYISNVLPSSLQLPHYSDFTESHINLSCLPRTKWHDVHGNFNLLLIYFGVFTAHPVDTEKEMVSVTSAVVWVLLCSLAVMRLDDALKAYLITGVQAHYNTVNILKITLRTHTNSRDFQLYCALLLVAAAHDWFYRITSSDRLLEMFFLLSGVCFCPFVCSSTEK